MSTCTPIPTRRLSLEAVGEDDLATSTLVDMVVLLAIKDGATDVGGCFNLPLRRPNQPKCSGSSKSSTICSRISHHEYGSTRLSLMYAMVFFLVGEDVAECRTYGKKQKLRIIAKVMHKIAPFREI